MSYKCRLSLGDILSLSRDLLSLNIALEAFLHRVSIAGLKLPLGTKTKPKYVYDLAFSSGSFASVNFSFISLPALLKIIILVLSQSILSCHFSQNSMAIIMRPYRYFGVPDGSDNFNKSSTERPKRPVLQNQPLSDIV